MKYLTAASYATMNPLLSIWYNFEHALKTCERHGEDNALSPYRSVIYKLDGDYIEELAAWVPVVGWCDRHGKPLESRPTEPKPEVVELDDEIPF